MKLSGSQLTQHFFQLFCGLQFSDFLNSGNFAGQTLKRRLVNLTFAE
jgi:hypothetical protein